MVGDQVAEQIIVLPTLLPNPIEFGGLNADSQCPFATQIDPLGTRDVKKMKFGAFQFFDGERYDRTGLRMPHAPGAERFEQFWRTCCLSGFLTAQAALPALEANGGSLLFTGASASLRGRPNFAHFAAAKSALRTLAQALAREYGPRGVHVGHVVVDGIIDGDIIRQHFGDLADKLGDNGTMNVDDLAAVFWYLHTQAPSVWTFELDARPYKEQW